MLNSISVDGIQRKLSHYIAVIATKGHIRVFPGSRLDSFLCRVTKHNPSCVLGEAQEPTFIFLLCHQSGVHHALNPDQYRGVFGADGEKYAKDVQEIIEYGTSGHVAAFISEAIQVRVSSGLQAFFLVPTDLTLVRREWGGFKSWRQVTSLLYTKASSKPGAFA